MLSKYFPTFPILSSQNNNNQACTINSMQVVANSMRDPINSIFEQIKLSVFGHPYFISVCNCNANVHSSLQIIIFSPQAINDWETVCFHSASWVLYTHRKYIHYLMGDLLNSCPPAILCTFPPFLHANSYKSVQ